MPTQIRQPAFCPLSTPADACTAAPPDQTGKKNAAGQRLSISKCFSSPTAPLSQNVQQRSCLSIFENLPVSTGSEYDPKLSL